MISSKRFESVDGVTSRFLSDFIIQSEQHCRVYMYKYNPSCAIGATCDTIVGGVYVREVNAPQSADLVTLEKWDLVDNSIVFYITPTAGVTIVVEVATTPEEFGDVVAMPIVAAAQGYADAASVSATSATASATSAIASATSATASATSATASASSALGSATTASNAATASSNSAITSSTQAGIATTAATIATTKATEAAASALSASTDATTATTQAGIATTGATTATTKAADASISAAAALVSETNAAASALSVDAANIVHLAGAETITGVKTFTNGIVTPNIPLSGLTAYHLLSGSLALTNSVTTAGMGTFLYTGNTTTLPIINLGMDIQSQWGNLATETFGYLIEIKSRSAIGSWYYVDSVRGITKAISSDSTVAEVTDANMFTLSTVAGVTTVNIGTSTKTNTNAVTYVMTVWQTTHKITGTTNNNKAFNCHYNPFTGLTIDGYEGSGLDGHEIPHHLGRKLGFVITKNLSAITNWTATYQGNEGSALYLNLTNANAVLATGITGNSDTSLVVSTDGTVNTSTNQYIMYGWANSYFDEANTLIGNYEVGVYQGSVAGNKVTTRGKPAWVMVKRLDTTGNWYIVDNLRATFDEALVPNASSTASAITYFDPMQDGFVLTTTVADINASGGQYLYMVVYDNDSGSGKSKYQLAQDTSAINLNAVIPFANGVDVNGTKNTVLTKNETVSGLTLTQGKNYVYAKNDGLYGVEAQAPQYGSYNGFGDYFDVTTNKWYQSPSAYSNNGTTTTGFTVVSGTLVSTNGALVLTNGTTVIGYAHNLLTLTSGKKYRVKLLRSSGNDSWAVKVGTTANGVDTYTSGTQTVSGEFTFDFVAVATNYLTVSNITATTGLINTFDNIAIYPINNDGSVDILSATPITESRNYLDAIVYADAGGQPTYIEQLPKIEYKDAMQVDTLKVLSGFDLNQSIYNVTTSRVIGATYINTSGKQKVIKVTLTATAGGFNGYFTVAGIAQPIFGAGSNLGLYSNDTAVIPVGAKYSLTATGMNLTKWVEVY